MHTQCLWTNLGLKNVFEDNRSNCKQDKEWFEIFELNNNQNNNLKQLLLQGNVQSITNNNEGIQLLLHRATDRAGDRRALQLLRPTPFMEPEEAGGSRGCGGCIVETVEAEEAVDAVETGDCGDCRGCGGYRGWRLRRLKVVEVLEAAAWLSTSKVSLSLPSSGGRDPSRVSKPSFVLHTESPSHTRHNEN